MDLVVSVVNSYHHCTNILIVVNYILFVAGVDEGHSLQIKPSKTTTNSPLVWTLKPHWTPVCCMLPIAEICWVYWVCFVRHILLQCLHLLVSKQYSFLSYTHELTLLQVFFVLPAGKLMALWEGNCGDMWEAEDICPAPCTSVSTVSLTCRKKAKTIKPSGGVAFKLYSFHFVSKCITPSTHLSSYYNTEFRTFQLSHGVTYSSRSENALCGKKNSQPLSNQLRK